MRTQAITAQTMGKLTVSIILVILQSFDIYFCFRIPECREEQRGFVGLIKSRNYPDNYPNSMECEWTIYSPESHQIRLQFTNFDLERSLRCRYDSLKIYKGDTHEGELVGSYCGNEIPDTMIISGSYVTLLFTTDPVDTRAGFLLTWTGLENVIYAGRRNDRVKRRYLDSPGKKSYVE